MTDNTTGYPIPYPVDTTGFSFNINDTHVYDTYVYDRPNKLTIRHVDNIMLQVEDVIYTLEEYIRKLAQEELQLLLDDISKLEDFNKLFNFK